MKYESFMPSSISVVERQAQVVAFMRMSAGRLSGCAIVVRTFDVTFFAHNVTVHVIVL